jgi:DNA-binding transcriptional LysR family regulator
VTSPTSVTGRSGAGVPSKRSVRARALSSVEYATRTPNPRPTILDSWSGVDVRHLAAFRAVAETGSFGSAARNLGYTQSAISHQVATLERIVGHRLFDRSSGPGRATLTAAGTAFAAHAEAAIANLYQARAALDALAPGANGTVRVGSFQSVSAQIVPRLIREIGRNARPISIELIESLTEEQVLAGLARGELDVAFTLLPVAQQQWASTELFSDPYFLVSSPYEGDRIDISCLCELSDTDLIAPLTCRHWAHIAALLRAAGVEPRYAFRTDDSFALKGLVQSGIGIAFVTRQTLETMGNGLAVSDVDDLVPPRRIALTWSRTRELSPIEHSFISLTREICSDLAREGA